MRIAVGGINGIGLIPDLALLGIPALLVDKRDFPGCATAHRTREAA